MKFIINSAVYIKFAAFFVMLLSLSGVSLGIYIITMNLEFFYEQAFLSFSLPILCGDILIDLKKVKDLKEIKRVTFIFIVICSIITILFLAFQTFMIIYSLINNIEFILAVTSMLMNFFALSFCIIFYVLCKFSIVCSNH